VYIWAVGSAVRTESTTKSTSQEAKLQDPCDEYANLGKLLGIAVARSDLGEERSRQLGLEENHRHILDTVWM
jgi:hypothetical protein